MLWSQKGSEAAAEGLKAAVQEVPRAETKGSARAADKSAVK